MRYLTFALAKGRLAKTAMEMFEKIGIQCEEMKDEKTRKLIFVNEELNMVRRTLVLLERHNFRRRQKII